MDLVSFNDIPSDVYKIIIDYIVIRLDRNDFKNYTLANPRSLLDNHVIKYINISILNENIKQYFEFVENYANEHKVLMQKNFDDLYRKMPPNNFNFYNSLIGDVTNSNYYNYDLELSTIIYDNLADLIPFYSTYYPRTRYYHLIHRLLNIYNVRGKNQFRITFMLFINKLKNNLLDENISKLTINKIIIKVIQSLNWGNKNNILD
jgi:hypothetical protein